MYLDRYYVKHHTKPSLKDAGLKLFKNIVFDEVKADVVKAMLVVIDTEREGGEVDRELLRQCVEVFDAMGMGTLEVYVDEHLYTIQCSEICTLINEHFHTEI